MKPEINLGAIIIIAFFAAMVCFQISADKTTRAETQTIGQICTNATDVTACIKTAKATFKDTR